MRLDERESWRRADDLFAELIDLPAAERRQRLAASDLDAAARAHVEALCAAAAAEWSWLDSEIDWSFLASADDPSTVSDLAGRRFGAYLLDEEIGRGGMAVVYRAHRADGAFDQQVAVKILGVGLLPLGAGERFRREQQVLSRLRHPHIATMLDGGVAEDGTPFLVMELLDGRPIDRHCAEERLDVSRRARLLLQVCEAVGFAHRNLVVHRDLKPSNILVDAAGRVKLLDFGIAKLLEEDDESQPRTMAQIRFLTPGFAAPEQVAGDGVTTSTDVFALGKLLERLIDPAHRLAGSDLGNIVAQATRAEPERRYADARALADDLESWLGGRPVRATPTSLRYRFGKAVRRHRGRVAAAALLMLVAAVGLAATLVQARKTRREERVVSAVSGFLVDLFQASDPAQNRGREITVRELLDRGAAEARRPDTDPELRTRLLEVLAGVFHGLGQYERSAELLREAIELLSTHPRAGSPEALAALRDDLGVALLELDRLDEAEPLLAAALVARRSLFGDRHPAVGESLFHQGILASSRGDFASAESRLREALAIRRGLSAAERADVAETLHHFGTTLSSLGRFPEAEAALREALALHREALGLDHPDVAHDLNALANVLTRGGRLAEAEAAMQDALGLRRRLYEESHPLVAQTLNDLAVMLEHGGQLVPAAEVYRQALASYRSLYGPTHQATTIVGTNLGRLLLVTGEFGEAAALFESSLAALSAEGAGSGGSERNRAIALAGLGEARHALGAVPEAEAALREALALARDPIRDVAFVAMAALELGRLELARGRLERAETLLAEAEAGYRERYGPDHIRTARAASWLAVARFRRGDLRGGEALLRSALEVQERSLPAKHPHLTATRDHLAALAAARGRTG